MNEDENIHRLINWHMIGLSFQSNLVVARLDFQRYFYEIERASPEPTQCSLYLKDISALSISTPNDISRGREIEH